VAYSFGSESSLTDALRFKGRVISALLMREMVSRYGRENLAFAWLVLEPMILTTGVMILWSLFHHDSHGLVLVEFVLSGYMPLTLWRHVSSQATSCLRQNASLLYHRQVRVLDIVVARCLLEVAGTTLALIVVYGTLRVADIIEPFANLGQLFAGWLFMAWLAFAVALVLAAASERFHFVEKLVAPFQYLILPISGMFFMVAWLPGNAQKWALYVPLVHCFELFRAGLFGDSVQTFYDTRYLTCSCIFVTAIGLLMIRRVSRHIEFE
jgi:capsular polysaccharide transport system permease protein